MSSIIFVTGVSTSGKTTLRNSLPSSVTIDIDEGGTPKAGALSWLAWRAEELLAEATEEVIDTGKSVVVTGIVWPHKVIESTYIQEVPDNIGIDFVMLTVTKKDLRTRFKDRLNGSKPVGPYVDYNWHLQKRLRQQVAYQRNGFILPPTYTPQEVTEFVKWRLPVD